MKYTRKSAVGAVLMILGLFGIFLASPASSQQPSKAVNPHAVARIQTHLTVKVRDGQGRLVKVIHRRGIQDHGTLRLGPVAGGTATAAMSKTGQSTIGKKLWTFTVFTKASWQHKSPVCITICTVHMIKKGTQWHVFDNHWRWAGIQDAQAKYTSCGWAHCGYHHMAKGEFDGSDLMGFSVTEYPKITIDFRNDGTMEWWRSCDC